MVRRGEQTAADFDASGLGFGRGDQPRRQVAVDLGDLILIDCRFTAVVLRPALSAQRPEHGENRRGRHQREHKPQRHQAVPGRNDAFRMGISADAPLYTTGGKPGN